MLNNKGEKHLLNVLSPSNTIKYICLNIYYYIKANRTVARFNIEVQINQREWREEIIMAEFTEP